MEQYLKKNIFKQPHPTRYMKRLLLALALSLVCMISLAQYPGWKSTPEIQGNDVTFKISAPKAVNVKVYGDFLPGVNEYGLGGSAEMQEINGTWVYTAKDLKPDFYFYYFEIDGIRVLDPSNLQLVCNYSEFYNSFLIEGEQSANFSDKGVNRGTLTSLWYYSPEYGDRRHMNVYLPYGYTTKKKYPVLYMIPGGGDDEDTWVDMGRLPQIMDHMIASGEAEEMIVVMVNAMANQLAAPHIMDVIPGAKYHMELLGTPQGQTGGEFVNDFKNNIIPTIEKNLSVRKGRDSRAVCGVSMGGVYELYILENYPELFSNIAFFGSGIMSPDKTAADNTIVPICKEGYNLMFIAAGQTDIAAGSAKNLMEAMDRAGKPYTYYDSKDGHNWRSWRRDLQQLTKVLFK